MRVRLLRVLGHFSGVHFRDGDPVLLMLMRVLRLAPQFFWNHIFK